MGRALTLAMAGRIEEAEVAFEKTVQWESSRLQPILMSRAWYIDRPRGDYDGAVKDLEEPSKTGMIIPFLYRGLIYARIGKADLALADFAEVINRVKARPDWFAIPDFFPRRLAFLLGRGEAYVLKGDLDRAQADGDEAVRCAPASAEARLLRARVYDKRGKPDLAEADRREAARLEHDPILASPEPRTSHNHARP
jgi:tetratricopeptide (TPR) repeat protein